MEEFYQRLGFHFGLGVCRVHYGSVLVVRGEWALAETEFTNAANAIDRAGSLPASSEAASRLGELRRRQGRLAEAAELFARAGPHPIAVVGAAALALDRGVAAVAVDTLEQLLAAVPTTSRTQRADALAVLTQARSAIDDLGGARRAAEDLAEVAAVVGSRPLQAAAAAADGLVAAARGEHAAASWRLEAAVADYERSGMPYEAARTREDLAAALAALGRAGEAARQYEAAAVALRQLGAQPGGTASRPLAGVLSPREEEVRGLVSRGMSDREIGEHLHISPHTVHRHVSNILTKLGVSSRAAAAQVARLGLR